MIKTKDTSSGIVMLSFYMMPNSKIKRFNLALKFKKEMHFVIENMFLKIEMICIEQIFLLNKFTKNSDLIFNSLKNKLF